MGEGLGFYKEYVAGMNAGLATVAVGHPFDTVKVTLFTISQFRFFVSSPHLCLDQLRAHVVFV